MLKKITLPEIGEGIDAVEITDIHVKVGEKISKDDTLITVETEKASMDIPSEFSGIIKKIFIKKGETLSPKSNLIELELSYKKVDVLLNNDPSLPLSNNNSESNPQQTISSQNNNLNLGSEHIYTSPSVRKFSRKLGCDLSLVKGTGPKGRILKEDVEKYISKKLNDSKNSSKEIYNFSDIDFSIFGPIEKQKINKIKNTTGNRLQAAWNSIPQVTQFDEADITELDIYRKSFKIRGKKFKISFLPFLIKILIPILKEYPIFNSSLDTIKNNLIIKKYINIGIAVDTPNGLIVPVIKNIDKKDIVSIMNELIDISKRCRNKKIKPDELQGSCITISSLGGIGGTYFTPIVNPPEVAIIGISKVSIKPIYKNGNITPRKILPFSLTYDHRVIDGADAARFTTTLSNSLNNFKSILNIK